MSDQDQDQKTEEPTPKQRERFREKGDVSRSQDLAAVVAIAAGTGAILAGWGIISNSMTHYAASTLGHLEMHGNYSVFFFKAVRVVLLTIAPVGLAGMVLGVAAQIAQVGFNFSFKPMEFNPNKFNPLPKLKSMLFSIDTVIEITKSIVKVTIIGLLAAHILWDEVSNNGRLLGLSPIEVLSKIGSMCLRIVLMVIVALAFISVVDVMIERWRHTRKMKMTKEEVKQEHKNQEGDPLVKSRIRGKQREMAMSRMRGDISKADVVVVNPTHYSVAIQYDMAKHNAPVILAAGVDKLAAQIRTEARHNNIPVVSDPPLARALYRDGKVGRPIPRELFSAVASLLAWVYKVTGKM
ncbi:MAG: flagellar biosynthesis protein FlhB [Deltaproteobacteria bacterium]|nr:flagellar biosynthesis protein FlhB [Deltaproteobacteria bacterium]MBN2673070.1 flagellar biosynthesis protein FlhB [Deltaproteobacteria bacterium]